ncbi:hypothetical protein AtDm6_2712 [Acetobacter tropicalis]|uniref:Uncharacterized protein n=1 Tax=Acetobacter tropicalis TaxID=104102 RepID=A0A094ZHC1_9PROT|nr:hypothetical protein AtDm6_2712 [Acetobacter tropicalis]
MRLKVEGANFPLMEFFLPSSEADYLHEQRRWNSLLEGLV